MISAAKKAISFNQNSPGGERLLRELRFFIRYEFIGREGRSGIKETMQP